MTIQKLIDKEGNVLRYRTRVERKELGVVNRSFAREIDAIRFLNDFERKYPSGQPSWVGRGIRLREIVVEPNNRAKILNQPTMQINGCTLKRGQGRCEPMDKCEHYWTCLCTTADRGWPGWTRGTR